MSFYDEVMRELVLALGGALFLANALALVRRRGDARRAVGPAAGSRTARGRRGPTQPISRRRRWRAPSRTC